MTKIYLTAFAFFVYLSAHSQIKKNDLLVGGQLSLYSSKVDYNNGLDQRNSGAGIGVSLGKAFKDNKVAGINLGYSPSKQTNYLLGLDTLTNKSFRIDAGIFYRAYKMLFKDFYIFGQGDISYFQSKQNLEFTSPGGDLIQTQHGGYLSLTPGFAYQVFKKVQLEITIPGLLSLNYTVNKQETDRSGFNNYKNNSMSFSTAVSNFSQLGFLTVGFRLII